MVPDTRRPWAIATLLNRTSVPVLGAILAFAALSPILFSGLYADDVLSTAFPGTVARSGKSLYRIIVDNWWASATGQARLYPVAIANAHLVFNLGGYEPIYLKLYHVLLIAGFVCLASYFIARFSGSSKAAAIFLILCPALFHARPMYDPLTSFIGLIPTLILLIFGQAVLLDSYLRNGGWFRLTLSVILFAIALLTYELSLVMAPMNVAIALRRVPIRRAAIVAVPYLVVLMAYLLTSLALRSGVVYDGIDFGDPSKFTRTFLVNVVAAIPFSYRLLDPHGIFAARSLFPAGPVLLGLGAALAVSFLYLWIRIARQQEQTPYPALGWTAAIGLLLWMVPAAIVAMSFRYQIEINKYGFGYTSSLMGTVGFTILIACAITVLLSRFQVAAYAVAPGVLLAALPALAVWSNDVVYRLEDANYKTAQRHHFVRAAEAGLFDDAPEGALIFANFTGLWLPWLSADFVWVLTGKRFEIKDGAGNDHSAGGRPAFLLRFERGEDAGWQRYPAYRVALQPLQAGPR